MLFYEWKFIIPFIIFFIFYVHVGRKAQNLLLVFAAYFFYSMWSIKFLAPLFITTLVDYTTGRLIQANNDRPGKRKLWLAVSICLNLGMLAYFKYMNFFVTELAELIKIPINEHGVFARIILPAGISFYTFQSMSYVIDVYRRHIPAERNFIDFSAFVSYFPHLVAGPIQRAEILLLQITRDRVLTIEGFLLGCRLFVVGLFKKLVIGDNIAKFVDPVFAAPQDFSPIALAAAAYGFTVQIYCDFSGYTDMARGISKMMGINLTLNFNFPYFAQGFRDFWKRWHISLSTWFRDYVYIPLGGNRRGENRMATNLIITFLLSGLWHGAGWTYLLWGAYHGTLVVLEHIFAGKPIGRFFGAMPALLKIFFTFHLVVLGWVLFRSQGLDQFIVFIDHLFTWPDIKFTTIAPVIKLFFFAFPLLVFDFIENRAKGDLWEGRKGPICKGLLYGIIAFLLILFSAPDGKQFIYFQF